jgi:hypothetical protein
MEQTSAVETTSEKSRVSLFKAALTVLKPIGFVLTRIENGNDSGLESG